MGIGHPIGASEKLKNEDLAVWPVLFSTVVARKQILALREFIKDGLSVNFNRAFGYVFSELLF